jgi:DNA polymerase I-like protein with 3'-5' exonuclease and polymerase domains
MKRKFRDMLIAPPGKLIVMVDLSQAESWIVAYLSNEIKMKEALAHGDIHTQTASEALFFCPANEVTKPMRYTGKRCNHALGYRMSGKRLTQVFNKESDQPPFLTITNKQGEEYHDNWHRYYDLKQWWYSIEEQLDRNRTLITPYGRKRTFYGNLSNPYERHEVHKQATAHVPQSTIADHFTGKLHPELNVEGGLKEVYRQIIKPSGGEIELCNMSHDSLALYCPKNLVRDITEQCKALIARPIIVNGEQFTIPVDAEIGERYGSLEKEKVA